MKRLLSICAATILCALTAGAISVPSNHLLGTIDPATPADPLNEAGMVNFLGTILGDNPGDPNDEVYTLLQTAGVIPNPAPLATGGTQVEDSRVINLGSGGLFTWVIAKYGTAGQVYYIGDLSDTIVLPRRGLNGNGISHYTLFGPPGTGVPDGGTTVLLLGWALAGLGVITRQIRK